MTDLLDPSPSSLLGALQHDLAAKLAAACMLLGASVGLRWRA